MIAQLEIRMALVVGKYKGHEFQTADGIWQDVVTALRDTMEQFFSGAKPKNDTEYQDKQIERRRLAKQYADIKGSMARWSEGTGFPWFLFCNPTGSACRM